MLLKIILLIAQCSCSLGSFFQVQDIDDISALASDSSQSELPVLPSGSSDVEWLNSLPLKYDIADTFHLEHPVHSAEEYLESAYDAEMGDGSKKKRLLVDSDKDLPVKQERKIKRQRTLS